ncbi:hypothetical protein IAU59_001246 [Kwoniella sp. CBS 9459]
MSKCLPHWGKFSLRRRRDRQGWHYDALGSADADDPSVATSSHPTESTTSSHPTESTGTSADTHVTESDPFQSELERITKNHEDFEAVSRGDWVAFRPLEEYAPLALGGASREVTSPSNVHRLASMASDSGRQTSQVRSTYTKAEAESIILGGTLCPDEGERETMCDSRHQGYPESVKLGLLDPLHSCMAKNDFTWAKNAANDLSYQESKQYTHMRRIRSGRATKEDVAALHLTGKAIDESLASYGH